MGLSFGALITAWDAMASSIQLTTLLFSEQSRAPHSPGRLGAEMGKPTAPSPAGFLPGAADGSTEGGPGTGGGGEDSLLPVAASCWRPQRWPFTQQHPWVPFSGSSSSAGNYLAASAHPPASGAASKALVPTASSP